MRAKESGWKEKKPQISPLRYAPVETTILWRVIFRVSRNGPLNCRSLGCAPNEQKIKLTESISISSVHFTLNLPQASRLLGMTTGRANVS